MSETKGFQVPKKVMLPPRLFLKIIFLNVLPKFHFSCVRYLGLVLCSIYNSPEL